MNQDITNFFNSTKIRIDNTLLHKFRVFCYTYHDKIERINIGARRRDNGCNIQRIGYPECNALFNELKNSATVQEKIFMTDFNKSIDVSEGYNVRGYLI